MLFILPKKILFPKFSIRLHRSRCAKFLKSPCLSFIPLFVKILYSFIYVSSLPPFTRMTTELSEVHSLDMMLIIKLKRKIKRENQS